MIGENEPGGSAATWPYQHLSTRDGVSLVDFRSQDLEQTRIHVSQYGDHRRVVHGGNDFFYAECSAGTGLVRVGHTHRSFRQTLHATIRRSTLFLNLFPGETIDFGRRLSYELEPNCAIVCPAGRDYTRRGSAGEAMALSVEPALLESEIDARAPRLSRRWLVQPVPIWMSSRRRAELAEMLAQLSAVAARDATWDPYVNLTMFERAAAGWLAELLLEASGVTAVSQASLHRLARLTRWIDEHLAEEITLDRMCAVVGVSWRTLQKSMLAAHGQTPLEYVNARRMTAARKRLEAGSPREQVATIALDCGFRHLGRFAASYRAAFGERPSETTRTVQAVRVGKSPSA